MKSLVEDANAFKERWVVLYYDRLLLFKPQVRTDDEPRIAASGVSERSWRDWDCVIGIEIVDFFLTLEEIFPLASE